MTVEFTTLQGEDARIIDPDGIQWPDSTVVVYAMEGNMVVGRIAIMPLPHLEGAWVAEDKRGTTLAAHLVKEAESLLAENGNTHALAFSHDAQPEVADYLQRFGYTRLPVTVYTKEIK